MDDLASVIDAFRQLLQAIGVEWTTAFVVLVAVLGFGWRIYNDRRKDREVNDVIVEKERTIQRMANELREQRVLIFKKVFGWSDDEIERFILLAQDPHAEPAPPQPRREQPPNVLPGVADSAKKSVSPRKRSGVKNPRNRN